MVISVKNVVVLFGSPHPNGATAELLTACLSGLPQATVTQFDCFSMNPAPCDDCRFCHTSAACRHRDLDAFYAALEAADVLIVASPVYNRSFTAPMKAVIDRLQRYWAARFVRGQKPPIATRKAAVLLTAGGSGRRDGAYLAQQLAPVLTILNCAPAVAVHADNTDREPLAPATLAAARAAGRQAAEMGL